MKKQIIAVDIDDVLGSQNEAMRLYINDQYGLDLKTEDYAIQAPYFGYWEKVWGVDAEEGAHRVTAFLNSKWSHDQPMIEGAAEIITALRSRYTLVVVTARRDAFADVTHQWLEKHFPATFDGVSFVPVWDPHRPVSKAVICKEIGADFLVDDNVEHCNLAAEEGIQSLLFGDYGWNRYETIHKDVLRVKDWQEVKEYFDERG